MEPGRNDMLEHFQDVSTNLFQSISAYHTTLEETSAHADSFPEFFKYSALSAATKLKIDVSGSLYRFDELFERFLGCLDEKERKSMGKIRFLLDEVYENQAVMNAIHEAHEVRLKWLVGRAGNKPPGIDLGRLPLNDTVIMAESLSMFRFLMRELFLGDYRQAWDGLLEKHPRPEFQDDARVHNALKAKAERLEELGMDPGPYAKHALEESYGP